MDNEVNLFTNIDDNRDIIDLFYEFLKIVNCDCTIIDENVVINDLYLNQY